MDMGFITLKGSNTNKRALTAYQFPIFSKYRILFHGVFTRHSGYSNHPFWSLNLGTRVGDDVTTVKQNLKLLKESISAKCLVYMNQIHDTNMVVLKEMPDSDLLECSNSDALITSLRDVALLTRHADCQGILIYDPINEVISNIHCGWRGNVKDIIGKVVRRMVKDFGSKPQHMIAGIGPSLGPCCCEFRDYPKIFPDQFRRFMERKNYFNLWELSRWQLENAGLLKENISYAGICTRCRTDLFYSYRGEGVTGRFGVVVMLMSDPKRMGQNLFC